MIQALPPFLCVSELTYSWPKTAFQQGGRKLALDQISFDLQVGQIVALLGPNGAGKSTLLKIIAGVFSKKISGDLLYRGQSILEWSQVQRAQKIAYITGELNTEFPMTALEVVLLGRTCWHLGGASSQKNKDLDQAQWAMELTLSWHLRNRPVHTLSGGEQQLITLAKALAQGAQIILLDEALSRMDLHHQAAIGKILRALTNRGYAVIWVSHDVNFALEWADSAVLLKTGKKIAHGPLHQVITQKNIQILYPGSSLFVGVNPISIHTTTGRR